MAIAALAYMLAKVLHEALDHGAATLLSSCEPRLLTTADFEGSFITRFTKTSGWLSTVIFLFAGSFNPGGAYLGGHLRRRAVPRATSGLAWPIAGLHRQPL